MASIEEAASQTRFEAISFITSVILGKRGVLTEKCSFVKSPRVAGKREAFQRMGNSLPLKYL